MEEFPQQSPFTRNAFELGLCAGAGGGGKNAKIISAGPSFFGTKGLNTQISPESF